MSATWQIECTDGKKEPISLSVGKTVIGRGQLLQIRELKVSRHHAEVQITEEGEFILKAMRPGLPCYYKKNGDDKQAQLQRGETVTLCNGDIFSLHSNPDCEFKVIELAADDTDNTDDGADGDKPTSADAKESEEEEAGEEQEEVGAGDAAYKEEEEEEEPSEEEEGSDWEEKKPKSKTGRTKKKKVQARKPKVKKPAAKNSRKPKKKAPSSEEEISEEENSEDSDSDYAGRRGRRQPARQQPRLPARRSTKPVSYNEDLMIEGISASESEQESDTGMPRIGRQKKADSDSDFQVDEDSGSDWDDGESKRKGSRRSGPPPKITPSRKSRARKYSESSEDEPEYIPRPNKRSRGAVASPAKKNRKSKKEPSESEEESSQEEENGSGQESGSEEGSE